MEKRLQEKVRKGNLPNAIWIPIVIQLAYRNVFTTVAQPTTTDARQKKDLDQLLDNIAQRHNMNEDAERYVLANIVDSIRIKKDENTKSQWDSFRDDITNGTNDISIATWLQYYSEQPNKNKYINKWIEEFTRIMDLILEH